jgi:prepilin-type processing-associated H-X9-DG protein
LQHNVLRDGWPQRQTAPPPSDRGDSRSDETPNTARIARPDARHGGKALALFVDGHIERLDTDNMDRAQREKYFTRDP